VIKKEVREVNENNRNILRQITKGGPVFPLEVIIIIYVEQLLSKMNK